MKNIKILLAFTCLIGIKINLSSQTTKVLFLGNSYTYTYDIPGLFEDLANSAGLSVYVDSYAQAGMAVANEQIIGHINDPISQSKISSQQWDYIVVQDNQGNYVYGVGTIPSQAGNANVTLYNQIKNNYLCSRIVYFSGWGPEGGINASDNTQACIDRVYGNMNFLNDNIGLEIVSPIGKAWNSSLNQYPQVDLYHQDNVHPSLSGSYLAAATLFVSIFRRDPTNLSFSGGLNITTAQNLRTIAYNIVTDPTIIVQTHLQDYTPQISINGNVLTVNASANSNYQWYHNGQPVGSNSNNYIVTNSGNYHVVVTNNDGCEFPSFPVYLTTVEIEKYLPENITFVSQNNSNKVTVNSKLKGKIIIYNSIGQISYSIEKETKELELNLNHLPSGLYILSLKNDKKESNHKLILK